MMELEAHKSEMDDEYEKLVIGMNPPRVTVDNNSSRTATLVKVDSANKLGSLLGLVQGLTDLNLTISRAYISSDGEWFMDVFHVVDQDGNKLSDGEVIDRIQQSLGDRAFSLLSLRRSRLIGDQPTMKHTSIELIGRDRPGLLSEIFAVLTDNNCNVVAAEAWTHNLRMASVVHITDKTTREPIDDSNRLAMIKQLLRYVLKGDKDKRGAKTVISSGGTHTERRLHQMMYADRDFHRDNMDGDGEDAASGNRNLLVTVENCNDKGYTVVNVRCRDRPKLIFDVVCTLTDLQYVVYHGIVTAEGPEAYQEYYIRQIDGCPVNFEGERQRLIHCLEAAIRRRNSEGVRLELCSQDRVGLLSDVTRIFRENGLWVTRAEVSTRGSQAANVFYVSDVSGNQVQSQTIEAVRNEIGKTVLLVKDEMYSGSPPGVNTRFSFSNLFRPRSEKFLYNLGLIRSYS